MLVLAIKLIAVTASSFSFFPTLYVCAPQTVCVHMCVLYTVCVRARVRVHVRVHVLFFSIWICYNGGREGTRKTWQQLCSTLPAQERNPGTL